MLSKIWCCFKPAKDTYEREFDSQDREEALEEHEAVKNVNPVLRTYLYSSDLVSAGRFTVITFIVIGLIIWWLGPVLGIFVVDPLVALLLAESQVITPDIQCYNHRLDHQVCDNDIYVDYYFWNITNPAEWQAGTAPPSYTQVGPYAFKAKEVRYNLGYNEDWTEVDFTYHQWAEFLPENSCEECLLSTPITSVNRAYLQFLAAPAPPGLDPESMIIYTLMPITMSIVRDSMIGFTATAVAAGQPDLEPEALMAAATQAAIEQWTDCNYLRTIGPYIGLTSPYLTDFPLPPGTPGFPFAPELCAYIPVAVNQLLGASITPTDFPAFGLKIDYDAATTFLNLAIGQSNATYMDPNAAFFMNQFLTTPREQVLTLVGSFDQPTATSLSTISEFQWGALQGYTASLVPTWGKLVYSGWLQSGGGGLVQTRPLSDWLYGFEDPILLSAAKDQAAKMGNADLHKLFPYFYTPELSLSYSTQTEPLDYFANVTGIPYNYSMLSYKDSDVGYFHPFIQQKRMKTGKAAHDAAQEMLSYRGIPFANKTFGIINVTGISEGAAFGSTFDTSTSPYTWDSVLSRPVQAQYTGRIDTIKEIDTRVYNMTGTSIAACNWTYYADWATRTGFDPEEYTAIVGNIPKDIYWQLMSNTTALREYIQEQATLRGSTLTSLDAYFNETDVLLDRCMQPESFQGMWDMSSMLACPTIYTFPLFLNAEDFITASTGNTSWGASPSLHGYTLGYDPLTGYALQGHKTYQVNHLVSRTAHLYPTLWVADGTADLTGLASDFITVPTMWIRMWWEPTDAIASLLVTMGSVKDTMFYVFLIGFPVLGALMLWPSIVIIKYGKSSVERRRVIEEVLNKNTAPSLKLSRHERDVVEAIIRQSSGTSHHNNSNNDDDNTNSDDAAGLAFAKAIADKTNKHQHTSLETSVSMTPSAPLINTVPSPRGGDAAVADIGPIRAQYVRQEAMHRNPLIQVPPQQQQQQQQQRVTAAPVQSPSSEPLLSTFYIPSNAPASPPSSPGPQQQQQTVTKPPAAGAATVARPTSRLGQPPPPPAQ